MLSNALDVCGYAALTYGAYVFGGRGAAAFVAGGALLLLSYVASGREISLSRLPKLVRVRRDEPAHPVRIPDPVITNADFDQWMAGELARARAEEQQTTTPPQGRPSNAQSG